MLVHAAQRVGVDVLASRYGDASHSEARYRPGDPAEALRIDGRIRKRSKRAQKGWLATQLAAVAKSVQAPEVCPLQHTFVCQAAAVVADAHKLDVLTIREVSSPKALTISELLA